MPINISNLQKLFELAAQEATPQTPPAANSSPAPVPAESTPQAQQPAQVNQQSQTSGQAISVEKIVDHLNGIRSGKSFNDPLVFTAITNIFNGLSAAEKAVLDKALSQLDRSIEQITKQQSPPNPNNQEVKGPSVQPQFGNQTIASAATPLQGPQQAQQMMSNSPVSGMMSGLMAEAAATEKQKSWFRSSNSYKNSLFSVNEKKVINLLKPIAEQEIEQAEKYNLAFQVLTKNDIIGNYIEKVFRARTSKKINIDKATLASLYINATKVLKRVGELQEIPIEKLKGIDYVLKIVFGTIETQNIFTEEKDLVETLIDSLSGIDVEIKHKRVRDFTLEENSLKSLHESVNKPKTTILINGEEVPFGSEKHRGQLTIVLQGLEDLKNCYRKGSSVRYTLAGACQKVRKILKDTTDRAEVEPAAPDTLNSEMGK